MQGNSKEGFIKTNKHGNLKNGIRVEMTQVDGIIIKEATKEGEIGKPNPQIKKGVNMTYSRV